MYHEEECVYDDKMLSNYFNIFLIINLNQYIAFSSKVI